MLKPRSVMGEWLALLFLGGIADLGVLSAIPQLLFPELAALSYDIFKRPRGKWASAPVMLVVTPTLTAILGLLLQHRLGYGPLSLSLAIAGAMLLIQWLKSPIAPAISAGALPIALDEGSWWYVAAVAFSTCALALAARLSLAWRHVPILPVTPLADKIDDEVESPASEYAWLPYFILFLALAMALVHWTGWRFLLYPPLIVIAYEMFAHANVCPWAKKPFLLVLTCLTTASTGLAIFFLLGHNPLAIMASVAVSIVMIQRFDLHVPPATAVGLLPFVIERPDWHFPLAVATGTGLLAILFHFFRKGQRR